MNKELTHLENWLVQRFLAKGECPTCAIVLADDGEKVLIPPAKDKATFQALISQVSKEVNALAVVLVSQGWMADEDMSKPNPDLTTPASQRPDAKEVFMLQFKTEQGVDIIYRDIIRENGRIKLGEPFRRSGIEHKVKTPPPRLWERN